MTGKSSAKAAVPKVKKAAAAKIPTAPKVRRDGTDIREESTRSCLQLHIKLEVLSERMPACRLRVTCQARIDPGIFLSVCM